MRSSTQRALSFLVSLALIVGAVAVYATLVVPTYGRVQQLRGEVVQKNTELKAQQKAVEDLELLRQRFQDLASAERVLSLTLPNEPFVSQMVNTLQGLALINDVELQGLQVQLSPLQSVGGPSYIKNLGAARAQFEVVGSYESFGEFLGQVERNVRLMDVVSVSIRGASGPTARRDEFQFSVTAQAYYQVAN